MLRLTAIVERELNKMGIVGAVQPILLEDRASEDDLIELEREIIAKSKENAKVRNLSVLYAEKSSICT